MFSINHRKISAFICFFIFFTKMVISATPIFSTDVDKNHILQVVLQLEIENNAKGKAQQGEDLQDSGTKYFGSSTEINLYAYPEVICDSNPFFDRNERDIRSFHPSVPTPPPNC
ncbi:hypothetical protein [Sphingobacterium sp. SYP-B4668]|uniref:hypothetical protein n=1 Tax=Sphingobacterium sp. SYP-B4668 TaxID=2996035 RepID=UPI0022DE612B|nr:hypothetical protein [Sphingobacterium sp. SYP-B4668]